MSFFYRVLGIIIQVHRALPWAHGIRDLSLLSLSKRKKYTVSPNMDGSQSRKVQLPAAKSRVPSLFLRSSSIIIIIVARDDDVLVRCASSLSMTRIFPLRRWWTVDFSCSSTR